MPSLSIDLLHAMRARVVVPAVCALVGVLAVIRARACARSCSSQTSSSPPGLGRRLPGGSASLFDFTSASADALDDWMESSDTARTVGKSKAAFVMQVTQEFRRAVLFAVLNPQPNGACFAGTRTAVAMDLSPFRAIALRARAQGDARRFKVVLRHRGEDRDPLPAYEAVFEAPRGELAEVSLPLTDFRPFVRGRLQPDEEPLDRARITSFGLQVFGGVYEETKQRGACCLEVDWVRATP